MPKANCTFRISDANRLIAVAKKNKLAKYRLEVQAGKMALIVEDAERPPEHTTELDRELADFEARQHG